MSIKEQVIAIIAEQAMLEPSDITLECTPEELGIDSMGLVESIFAIEETFDISVPFNANNPGSERATGANCHAAVAFTFGIR